MLLIAIPKSAGTSLVHTVGRILKIKIFEGMPKWTYDINCEDYPELQKYHSIMPERSSRFLERVTRSKTEIYREHLLPTERHLNILKKINRKVVVLLRKPDDIIDSYKRLKKSNKINFEQLQKDIQKFYDEYLKYDKKNNNMLIIHYELLIKYYQLTMKNIFKFWDLKMPKKFPSLAKKNFTGVGLKRFKGKSLEKCYL